MVATEISSDELIDSVISSRIDELNEDPCDIQHDLPFFVADTSQIFKQHQRWKQCLPNILPFYAVKCNPDIHLLKYLASLGVGFDCASFAEIQTVLDLGVDPSRVIFAHPCKAVSALRMASRRGVLCATFDNIEELDKIKEHAPNTRLLLRIFAEDDSALICLGNKFGTSLDTVNPLLLRAKDLGLDVIGVSFHIGSGASNPKAFVTAVKHAKQVFAQAEKLGFKMNILDVGGGFQDSNLENMALTLRRVIKKEFPKPIQVVAEPGRYFARSFYTMACKVISRRRTVESTSSSTADMLYLNDGIYGSFMNALIEHEIILPTLIKQSADHDSDREKGEHQYSIWGPTCDGIDCIAKEVTMNCEIKVGDWLKYENMGAYTVATSTQFNGFPNQYEVIYV